VDGSRLNKLSVEMTDLSKLGVPNRLGQTVQLFENK